MCLKGALVNRAYGDAIPMRKIMTSRKAAAAESLNDSCGNNTPASAGNLTHQRYGPLFANFFLISR